MCRQQGQRSGHLFYVFPVCLFCSLLKNGPKLNHGRAVSSKGPGWPTLEEGRAMESPADFSSTLSSGRPAVTAGGHPFVFPGPTRCPARCVPATAQPRAGAGKPDASFRGAMQTAAGICVSPLTRPSRRSMGHRGPPSVRHTAWLEKRWRSETVSAGSLQTAEHGLRVPLCSESHVRSTQRRPL